MKSAKKKRAVRKAKSGIELREVVASPEAAAADVPVCVEAAAASAESAASEARVVILPSSCTLRDTAELKTALLHADDDTPLTLDAAGVERVDTAALQVFAAFTRARARRGAGVEWRGANDTFMQAAQLLGLTAHLGIQAGPVG